MYKMKRTNPRNYNKNIRNHKVKFYKSNHKSYNKNTKTIKDSWEPSPEVTKNSTKTLLEDQEPLEKPSRNYYQPLQKLLKNP